VADLPRGWIQELTGKDVPRLPPPPGKSISFDRFNWERDQPLQQFFQRMGSDWRSWAPDPAAITPPPYGGTPEFRQRYYEAAQQLADQGILQGQRAKHPVTNKVLYKVISPFHYSEGNTGRTEEEAPERYDAWRMYMGMPQQHGTFAVSPYQPSSAKDPNQLYYRLRDLWPVIAQGAREGIFGGLDLKYSERMDQPGYAWAALQELEEAAKQRINKDIAGQVMGQYTIGKGFDPAIELPYYSYYDRWDLDKNSVEGQQGRFGKPFELYDRLYYEPNRRTVYWHGPPAKAPKKGK
jgi:hypothetical protein